jgi:hypothetical protein
VPKLKVKPLEWYMQKDHEDLIEEGYRLIDFRPVGRDGYYCRGNNVWFEYEGRGYKAYPNATRKRAREYFCYDLTVNDEAILMPCEVEAMRTVLKTVKDAAVRKALYARVHLHEQALACRESRRGSAKFMLRFERQMSV